jgi:hypothetical protein
VVRRTGSRRRRRRNLLVVGTLIAVGVLVMLVFSAISGDQTPSEEQREQEEIGQEVVTPAPLPPKEAGAPEDQQPPEE